MVLLPPTAAGRPRNFKTVLVYASHDASLRPSTFQLLSSRSDYDALLRAFLDSAFHAIACEFRAIEKHVHDQHDGVDLPYPEWEPLRLEVLSTSKPHRDLDHNRLTLTTLCHVAMTLCAREDIRKALSVEFQAVWDPESSLAVQLLQQVDTSNALELLKKGVEAVRMACWLDFYLCRRSNEDASKRYLFTGDDDGLQAARAWCLQEGLATTDVLQGVTATIMADRISTAKGVQAAQIGILVLSQATKIPQLNESQTKALASDLEARFQERDILATCSERNDAKSRGALSYFHCDLQALVASPDHGRSMVHMRTLIDALRDECRRSTLYGDRASLLLLGQSPADPWLSALTKTLASASLDLAIIPMRNMLFVKDSMRYGDEPVKLSRVEGDPCQQVAIIGMSCRVPGANDPEELWQLLQDGKDMCKEIPTSLYRYQDYHSTSYRERNVMRVSTGNFIADPQLFDRNLLGDSASIEDVRQMDPQQRLTILTAFETLQSGGYGFSAYKRPRKPKEWSSHLAYCSDDYREHLSQNIQPGFVANTHRAHLVARVNQTFGFEGAACTYDTACSSALVAVEAACNSLLAGETSAVITGGINVLTQPQITIGLDRGFFLSSSTQCLTLDDAGAGYSRADAVSLMLLKRLPDAVRDGDPILAVISSAATNHSGESFSITHPHGPTQRRLYQSGMLASNTLPGDISYIEMHGTGTQSGDLEEVTGIIEAFGQKKRRDQPPLVLGSVKANIGHSEAASGASSMIKTLKIYENGLVPRHVGIRSKLNSKLPPLDGFQIPMQPIKLERINCTHTLVDNFSAAGGNSSIVLDRGTRYRDRLDRWKLEAQAEQCRAPLLLFVSAASPFSLDAKRRRLVAFLDANKDACLREFCSAVSLSDAMFPYRLLATPISLEDAKACLSGKESICIKDATPTVGTDYNVGIAFSGQGAQYLDMARELYEHSPAFRAHIDRCGTVTATLGLPDLIQVIHPASSCANPADASTMAGTRTADSFSPAQFQMALIAVEVALASMLTDWGIKPICVVGHSLGEYAALWMAGVLTLRDLFSLVGSRALLMMELCEPNASSMLAVREGAEKVQQLLDRMGCKALEIACLNSPLDTVVAGATADIETLRVLCDRTEPKIKAMAIPVPYAFHSKAVEPLMERYEEVLKKHRLQTPEIRLASNVLGRIVPPGADDIDQAYLVRHLRQPVRFADAIADLQKQAIVHHWIEIGPHPTSIPMLKGCYASQMEQPAFTASFRRGTCSWQATLDMVVALASTHMDLDWDRVFRDLGLRYPHRALAPKLPMYPFDLEEYWVPFKDRGLRDHLASEASTKAKVEAKGAPSVAKNGTRHPIGNGTKFKPSKPNFSLLSSCAALQLSPVTAKYLAKVNQRPFRDFITGHVILGVPLAPATVFVELAQQAGHHWWKEALKQRKTALEGEIVIEVLDLSMVASLYLNEEDANQSIEVTIQGGPDSADGSIVQFFSHNQHQHQQHQYGSCRIRAIPVRQVQKEWSKLSHLVSAAAKAVRSEAASILRMDTIYKQFEAIVLYLDGFRGMNTIWMSEDGSEAVSEVKYNAKAIGGNYLCSPMLLDSLGGLTGFISNVGFAEGGWIYMAEAIGRIVTMPDLSKLPAGSDTSILVYARMVQQDDLSKGSAYFYLEKTGELMGMMEGIVFKRIRRDVLKRLVQMSSKAFADEAKRAAAQQPKTVKLGPSGEKNNCDSLRKRMNGSKGSNGLGQASDDDSAKKEARVELRRKPGSGECGRASSAEHVASRNHHHPIPIASHAPSQALDQLMASSEPHHAAIQLHHLGGPELRSFAGQDVLFLFPDGTGSARTYPHLGNDQDKPSLSVYGFDSPFLGRLQEWNRGVAELVERYVEMLLTVQPSGPYRVAGWSIGGIIALEVSRHLLSAGHQVTLLGIIDAPKPSLIQPLPAQTLDRMLARIDSAMMREHFRSCALTLPGYRCLPYKPSDPIPVAIAVINAEDHRGMGRNVLSRERDWRSFWSDSDRLHYGEVDGTNHWSVVEIALHRFLPPEGFYL